MSDRCVFVGSRGGLAPAREVPRARGRRPRQAFSLVEIGITVAILGLVLLPMLSLLGASSQTIAVTTEEILAQAAGFELLEQLLVVPYAELPEGRWVHEALVDGRPLGTASVHLLHLSPCAGMRRSLEIAPLSAGGRSRFKKVAVTLEWVPPTGARTTRRLELAAMVANDAR